MMVIGMAVASSGDATEAERPKETERAERTERQSRWPPRQLNSRPSSPSTWGPGRLSDFASNYPSSLGFDIKSPHIPESFQRPVFPQYEERYPHAPARK